MPCSLWSEFFSRSIKKFCSQKTMPKSALFSVAATSNVFVVSASTTHSKAGRVANYLQAHTCYLKCFQLKSSAQVHCITKMTNNTASIQIPDPLDVIAGMYTEGPGAPVFFLCQLCRNTKALEQLDCEINVMWVVLDATYRNQLQINSLQHPFKCPVVRKMSKSNRNSDFSGNRKPGTLITTLKEISFRVSWFNILASIASIGVYVCKLRCPIYFRDVKLLKSRVLQMQNNKQPLVRFTLDNVLGYRIL